MAWSCEVCSHKEFDLSLEEVTCQLCQHSVMFTTSNNTQKHKEKNDAGGGGKRSFDVEAETDMAGMDFMYHYYYHYQLKCVFLYYIFKL